MKEKEESKLLFEVKACYIFMYTENKRILTTAAGDYNVLIFHGRENAAPFFYRTNLSPEEAKEKLGKHVTLRFYDKEVENSQQYNVLEISHRKGIDMEKGETGEDYEENVMKIIGDGFDEKVFIDLTDEEFEKIYTLRPKQLFMTYEELETREQGNINDDLSGSDGAVLSFDIEQT